MQTSYHSGQICVFCGQSDRLRRSETYPKSLSSEALDPPQKRPFWGGRVPSDIFSNVGDTTLIDL
eukprot:UN24111